MSFSDLTLLRAFPDDALYDRFGNRYVFSSHRHYECHRRLQIIEWLTGKAPLYYL